MKRYARLLLAAVVALVPTFGTAGPAWSESGPGSGGDVVPGEVVVKLVRAADLAGVARDYRLDPTPLGRFGAQPIFRLRIVDGTEPIKRAEALLRDSKRVTFAEPNYRAAAPKDSQDVSWASGQDATTAITTQWATEKMQLERAHRISRGAGVTVAVLDTGVDAAHPLLASRLAGGFDFVDVDSDPSEQGPGGAFGHGTHVAGLIATVAPDAKIMPLRVLDPDGVGNVWVLAEALRFALNPDGDPTTADGAGVINLSISTMHRTRLLRELVETAQAAAGGAPVVAAAAGNSASSSPIYPAGENVDGLLAVGASTAADELAAFSSRGSWVHVTAPGVQIASSVPGDAFAAWSGTSMATALVSGEAALVRAADPGLGARSVARRIEDTGVRIDGDAGPRIDAAAALSRR